MEVPVAGSDQVKWARVMVPAQFPPSEPCCPASPDVAGTAACSPPSRSFYIWRIHNSSPAILELFGLDDNEAFMSGLQIVFEEPLSPYIAVNSEQVHLTHEEGIIFIYAVTISGVLYVLRIRAFYKYRSVSTLARSDIMQLSLVSELGRLDQITALSGVGDIVCVGGKSGSSLCYFVRNLNVETREHYFELKDSDAILGRLWGLVARAKNAGPIQSLKVQTYKARTLLFALHEDGIFKLWDLHSRSRLLNFNLYKGDSSGFIPKMMWLQEQDIGNRSTKVAFLLQKEEAKTQDAVHIYDLQLDQVDGAGGQAALSFQLQTHVIEGTVLDLKLLSDRFWKLDAVDGQFHLNCYSIKREELLESCELLEAELQDQLFQWPGDDWEELVLFQESLNTGSKTEMQLPVSGIFISRLLQPGVYQQHSLRKVLQKHKRNIPETDFVLLTREGLQREILAVIETENLGDDKTEHLMQWRDFCRDYFFSWKQSNVPYSLMYDYQTASIGLIRRQCVSFRRSLSNFEKVNKGGCSEVEFLDFLFKCTSTIVRQVGRVPYAVFGQVLLGNRHISVSHLCSVFLHFLDVGYSHFTVDNGATNIGVDVERKKGLEYRQRHRKLELQLILDLQHLRNFAGGWSHVLDSIERYIIQLTQETRHFSKEDNFEGLNGIISKRLVLKSTVQLSWNLFEAAKDLFFLLSYLIKIKGQVGISNNEALRIQRDLIMHVKNIFLRVLLVHWLSTNFAEVAPPEEFSLHLSTLHLDNVAANKPDSQHGIREMALAEILLSVCLKILRKGQISNPKGILSSDYLLDSTKFLTSWLMWGEDNGHNETLSSRSVALAAVLLQHGQYTALQEFLGIVDNFCNELELHEPKGSKGDWCARLHLLGCGLLGQTRNGLKESAIKSRVEKAVHYFFRVASVVGQEREDVPSLFSKIGMETSYLVHGAIASWKFHYYEWVMQIFEQNHELEGACQFAYAALQEADEAARCSIVKDTEISTAVLGIKGCLWANIFKFSLDKSKYKEAYCAIMSNPDKESKYVCLRRFLIVLCEQKAAEVLCGLELPYSGMLERVEQELLMKAQHSDLNANPNPFKLLYSFHMQRSNWRRAALYMYVYSVRMKEMGLAEAGLSVQFVLQEQLNSLAATINALHLVESMHAWLDLESIFSGSISSRPSSKRMRVYANTDAGYAMQRRKASYVDIQKLEKEYTLVLAKILLTEADVQLNVHGDDLSPENLVLLLVQAGFYEMAFTVLFQFWKDSALKSELERIFKIMAERWCIRQQDNTIEKPLSSHKLLLGSDRKLLLPTMPDEETSIETAKSLVAVATKDVMTNTTNNWLQVYLEKYTKLHPHLLVVVAETLLGIDRLIELPYWLVDMLKGGRKAGGEGMATIGANPSALFRIYLDFGRVMEAATLFLEYVKARSNLSVAEIVKRKRMCGVWFPYTLVDRLQTCLSELDRSEEIQNVQRLLEHTLSIYFEQVHTDSSDVKSLVQN